MVPASWLELAALPRTPNGKVDRRELTRRAADQESERHGVRGTADADGEGPGDDLRRGAGDRRGGADRLLLPARRPLAAGHAGGRRGCARRWGSSCRCAPCSRRRPSRRWPGGSAEAGERRSCPRSSGWRGRASCRSRSPRSASGSSTSWSPGARPTTSPARVRLEGRLEPAALRPGARRDRPPPRGAAHPLRDARTASRRRSSIAARRRAAARDRSAGLPRRRARPRPGACGARRRCAPSISAAGRCCGRRCCGWPARSGICLLTPAPHRLGRRVGRRADRRDVRPLRRRPRGRALAAGRAAGAVRRLRGLAARLAGGGRAGRRARLVARAPGGAPTVLELPTDHPRPAMAGSAGGGRRRSPARRPAAGSGGAGAARGDDPVHDPAGGVRGAALALRRSGGAAGGLAGRRALAAGAGRADRLLRQHAGAARPTWTGDPSFRELLGRAREETLAALAHQDLPFERLVEELAPERSLDRNPLFQVLLAVQEQAPELRLPGLVLRRLEPEGGTAKFDLSLELAPEGEGLAGGIEYRRDLFEPATVATARRPSRDAAGGGGRGTPASGSPRSRC